MCRIDDDDDDQMKQEKQCTCNATVKRAILTIAAIEKQ